MTGELFGLARTLKEIRNQELQPVEDFENTLGTSARTLPNWAITAGVQPGPFKPNAIYVGWYCRSSTYFQKARTLASA